MDLKINVPKQEMTLNKAKEGLALEAQFVNNAVTIAKDYLPAFVKEFKLKIKSAPNTENSDIELPKSLSKLINDLSSLNYIEVKDLLVRVPEGYEHNYLTALNKVFHALDLAEKMYVDSFKVYFKYVSSFLTNKSSKRSTEDLSAGSKQLKIKIDTMLGEIGSLFKNGSVQAEQPFKKLFLNTQEVPKAIQSYSKLAKRLEDFNIEKLHEETKLVSEMLDDIINQIQNGKIENMSSESLKSLTEGSLMIAELIEALSVFYFKTILVLNIVSNLEDFVKK
jgi:hypothetical protein